MSMFNQKLMQVIIGKHLQMELLQGNFGLEKENVRVDSGGKLARTPHPSVFGSKLDNPFIRTDFSESQIEMITPAVGSVDEVHRWIDSIHDIVSVELAAADEYLWPSSNPPALPDEEQIPIAVMGNPQEDHYRLALAKKYSRKRQLLSGVHVNFSFRDSFLRKLYEWMPEYDSYRLFKDSMYLKIARHILRYRWLLVYLTAASPIFNKTYMDSCVTISEQFDDESRYYPNMLSLRNSVCGYRNAKNLRISYDSIDSYVQDLQQYIRNGDLLSEKEYYGAVRLKTNSKEPYFDGLLKDGIDYLELRMIDLNPLVKSGVSKETLHFLHLFIIYSLLRVDEPYEADDQRTASLHHDQLLKDGILGMMPGAQHITYQDQALDILDDMQEMVDSLGPGAAEYMSILELERQKLLHPELIFAEQVKSGIQRSTYLLYHMNKAIQYAEASRARGFAFAGYEDLELSTQLLLKAAVRKGISFEILDRSDNFVLLTKGEQKEFIKQATKTSRDSYSTVLIMENKIVSKKVLARSGIRVPEGQAYESLEAAIEDYPLYIGSPIVIKPKSTNFGIGVTIFPSSHSAEEYRTALEMAFAHDQTVLLEQFLSGKEYRFLVIGDEAVGVLHRVPANVTGDGVHTIEQLIQQKNQDPLRGKGYRTPLEIIELDDTEKMFLRNQGLHWSDIPREGEPVWLRENSNISTGGDSIDYTDDVHDSYKQIAIRAAKAAGATFCGVDMMIDDISAGATDTNYGVIEINFNPAIHIHCYPYKGKNRKADDKILEQLFEPSA